MKNEVSILIVDDDNLSRVAINSLLTNLIKCDVIEAEDGLDAWNKYKTNKPHIVITDIMMPQVDGIELINKIRKVDKSTKIIVLSAFDEQKILIELVTKNLAEYIIKPLNIKKLEGIIKIIENLSEKEVNNKNKIYLSEEVYYDKISKTMYKDSTEIKFTKKEAMLVELLVKKHSQAISSYEIHNHIYELESDFNINAIRTLFKKIRKKLPENCIENIYGGSYKLNIIKK